MLGGCVHQGDLEWVPGVAWRDVHRAPTKWGRKCGPQGSDGGRPRLARI